MGVGFIVSLPDVDGDAHYKKRRLKLKSVGNVIEVSCWWGDCLIGADIGFQLSFLSL